MRILIIEDEERLAKLLKANLQREGYAVDYLTNGAKGEERIFLYQKDYDLVILDLMLPGKGGAEVCRNVRERHISVPILILTAKGEVDDKVSLFNDGADDYLVKPFSFKELIARIRALTRRPKESLPTMLQVNDLALSPAARKVFKNGKEIKLTLKEYSLLEYLMRHPNQVIKREQIYDNLWDFAFDSFSNVVDVHVKNLRTKIGGKNKTLETIRGVGYRING